MKFKCCICGKEMKGFGNNPYPIKKDGLCCDSCNMNIVIPARINEIYKKKEKLENE